jgi:hypothetical protein
MFSNSISAVRSNYDIDVYVRQNDSKLVHYWTEPHDRSKFTRELLCEGVVGKPAVIRMQNRIDVFFCKGTQLVHMWAAESTEWLYEKEVISSDFTPKFSPAAVSWENEIDIYFIRDGNSLIHIHASPTMTESNEKSKWIYEEEIISLNFPKICCSSVSNLAAIRNEKGRIDIFFATSETLVHGYVGDVTDWKMKFKIPFKHLKLNPEHIEVTKLQDNIDIFYRDDKNILNKIYCRGHIPDLNYEDHGQLCSMSALESFSVVRFGQHIDIYFVANDNKLYHIYYGNNNGWKFSHPNAISDSDVHNSVSAVRVYEKSIDVFYLSINNKLKYLCIGEGTNYDWSQYRYVDTNPIVPLALNNTEQSNNHVASVPGKEKVGASLLEVLQDTLKIVMKTTTVNDQVLSESPLPSKINIEGSDSQCSLGDSNLLNEDTNEIDVVISEDEKVR